MLKPNRLRPVRDSIAVAVLALAAGWQTARPDVVINEIHSSPLVKQERVEFVELHNTGPGEADVGGWRLTGGVDFTIPAGTRIPANAYLVLAQDPAVLGARLGVPGALGPWAGRLAGEGETLTLTDPAGVERDRVGYGLGFPWPTVGEDPGNSLELIHPALDNDLGGHWRPSAQASVGGPDWVAIVPGSPWRIWPGSSDPSPSVGGWRGVEFNDLGWVAGAGPVGYDPEVLGPATTGGTRLLDMPGNYSTFHLRRTFDAPEPSRFGAVVLEALFDDGFKVWLNGTLLRAEAMAEAEVPRTGTSTSVRENNGFQKFDLPLPAGLLRASGNVLAVQVANISVSGSSDCFFDCRLTFTAQNANSGPTPGRVNRAFATNAPPALRQVSHVPELPRSGQEVLVSVRATDPDGVSALTLEYQVVLPGAYIRFDDPLYATQWTTVAMNDAGLVGDAVAGDGVFSARIPAAVQRHRNLVRYRIVARDPRGAEVRVPYAEDDGRNFAYFVYNGVPAWTGAVRPGQAGGAGTPFTVDAAEMNRMPVYHLVARRQDVEDATWRDRSRGDEYFWTGTLVYDGRVYDHIRFRPRGGVWRYAMGKNMWKFDFNRGRDFRGRDNWGRRFRSDWTKLNLGASIQQGDYLHRGEQGMFESVGMRLFEMTGAAGSDTAFVQFRIVDEADEAPAGNQYGGDFWGVYLAVEQLDGRYLDARDLPDGNLYKMEGGFGDPNNLGPDGPVDSSDLRNFLNAYATAKPESWWRTNLNLETYFNYQAIVQAIHHYDIADGKNYFYYRNPVDGRWRVLPWDLDLTWSDNMYRAGQTGGDEPFKSRVLNNFNWANPPLPGIGREFRNRVREIRDLLWNEDEAYRLLDEHARLLRGTNQWSLIDADRAQWDYNPVMSNPAIVNTSKAGAGRFYQSGVGTRDFAGMVAKMKQYVSYRASNATFSLDTMSREAGRPAQPQASYSGAAGFPADRLQFSSSTPAAGGTTVRWRIGEITRPGHPGYDPTRPLPYELNAVVESGNLAPGASNWSPAPGVLRVGRLYRARVRHVDSEGRASNWSAPVEFTAGEPLGAAGISASLQVTELMYNPADEGFEFIELQNADPLQALELSGARFTDGIGFDFAPGTTLNPLEYVVLIRSTNIAAFRAAYSLPPAVRVLGTYSGALSNEGETVTVRASAGSTNAVSVAYLGTAPWPTAANGLGRSLVPVEGGPRNSSLPTAWRASTAVGGSPGRADPTAPRIVAVRRQAGALEIDLESSGVPVRVWRSTDLRIWSQIPVSPVGNRLTVPDEPGADLGFIRLSF